MRQIAFLVLVFWVLSTTVICADTLSNLGIGRAESERHAGMNLVVQLHGRQDDGKPTEIPIGLDKGGNYQKTTTTDAWLLVKPGVINAGKVKELGSAVADYTLDYDATKGGFWIDCEKLGSGSFWVVFTCKHEGGKTTYHILIFACKVLFDVVDQIGFMLNIQDPNIVLTDRDNYTLRNSSGFIGVDGRDVNPQFVMKRPRPSKTNTCSKSMANIKVLIYEDRELTKPGFARVQLQYNGGTTEAIEASGVAEFSVPEGQVFLHASSSMGNVIAKGPIECFAASGKTSEFCIYITRRK